jgi:cell division protein FtsB
MAEKKQEKTQEKQQNSNNLVKYLLITLFIIAIVITIASLFNWQEIETGKTYGENVEARIKNLERQVESLQSKLDNLDTRNIALFILVFISLALNIILLVAKVISYFKEKKPDIST